MEGIWGTAKTQKKIVHLHQLYKNRIIPESTPAKCWKESNEENVVGKISSSPWVSYGSKIKTILTLCLDDSPLRAKILKTKKIFIFLEIQ